MGIHMKVAATLLAGLSIGLAMTPVAAQDFYAGKTVRVIHGFGTGGGFDTAARTVVQHLPKHVPGQPEFVVESMPGAGSLIATNHVFTRAKPDGLTMGFLLANLLVDEAMGAAGIQFDSAKFEWLAAPSAGTPVCTFMAASGIKSLADWKAAKTPPKIGAIARGAEMAFSLPRLLETQAGLPMQIIVGHKGGNPALKLAAERGEIGGFCASLEATTILLGDALKSGDANVVLQSGETPHPQLAGIPIARDLVTTPDGADLIRAAVSGPQRLNRVFVFPPGTDKAKVALMRKALMATFADPAFVAAAEKSRMSVDPVSGEDAEQVVRQLHAVPKETLAKLKELLL